MTKNFVQILRDDTPVVTKGRKIVTKNRGDWVKVDDKEVKRLLSLNVATHPKHSTDFINDTVEIIRMFPTEDRALDLPINPMKIAHGYPATIKGVDSQCFVCISDNPNIRFLKNYGMFETVLESLTVFDVVLILASFSETIADTHIEQKACAAILPTLFAPYYQDCAFGVQNTKKGQAFYSAWVQELENGKKHALARALHMTSPTATFLPPDWGNR